VSISLRKGPLRFVFAANVISMLGSGMNSAAVAWYILEATFFERALCSCRDRRNRWAAFGCFFHGAARCYCSLRSGFALAGARHRFLLRYGVGARHRWRGHEYNSDGNGPKTSDGTRAKHIYFAGTFLQLVLALIVGAVAHNVSLVAGFAILACVYGVSFISASWPVHAPIETVPVGENDLNL
jgi:hypothetical protein